MYKAENTWVLAVACHHNRAQAIDCDKIWREKQLKVGMEEEKLEILKALSLCSTSNQWSMLDAVAKKVNKLMLDEILDIL